MGGTRFAVVLLAITAGCTSSSELDSGSWRAEMGSLLDLGPDVPHEPIDAGPSDLSVADLANCFVPTRDVSACPGDGGVGYRGGLVCDGISVGSCAGYGLGGGCFASHASCAVGPVIDGGPSYGGFCCASSSDRGLLSDQRCGDGPVCPNGQGCVSDRPGGRPYCACTPTGLEGPTAVPPADPTCAAVTADTSLCPGSVPAFVGEGPQECDAYFRAQCLRWASTESAGCTRSVAQCTNAAVGTIAGPRIECVRADHCDDAGVGSCGCGATAPCNDGQVCVVDLDGLARCHCAAVPTP